MNWEYKKFFIGLGKFFGKGLALGRWEIKFTWYF